MNPNTAPTEQRGEVNPTGSEQVLAMARTALTAAFRAPFEGTPYPGDLLDEAFRLRNLYFELDSSN